LRGVERGTGSGWWWWSRQRRGVPAMEGEVEDGLLLLSRVERELAWIKSEI